MKLIIATLVLAVTAFLTFSCCAPCAKKANTPETARPTNPPVTITK